MAVHPTTRLQNSPGKPTGLHRVVGCKGPGLLFFQRLLKIGLSGLKRFQFPLKIGYLLLDRSQLRITLDPHQVILSEFLSDVLLELTPQDSEVWISPYRSISVLKFVRLNTFDDEVTAHAVFTLGYYVAKGCSLSIPFAVLGHTYPRFTEDPTTWAKARCRVDVPVR